jgi:hypothetical protein
MMTATATPSLFATTDINLSAFLRCRGYALLRTERNVGGRVSFVFEDSPSRPRDVAAYFSESGLVPALRFAESARSLKGLLRE